MNTIKSLLIFFVTFLDQAKKVNRYSAWGIPRDPDDWTSELTGDLFAGRGFT